MESLYDKLIRYNKDNYYPMHMPGHKRNTDLLSMVNPYEIDITEIEGFDNLHGAEEILLDLSKRVEHLYHSKKSYLLINGSTGGLLAGISAVSKRGDKILMSRNCHKSVYHAVQIMGLVPVYLYPPIIDKLSIHGGIYAELVEEALIKHADIKVVIITSPTYEGIVSDIASIAKIVHKYSALLIVDEAHGAHLGFHNNFPKSAVRNGADIIIQSIHKTLPSFTQTAVLHSNREELNNKIEKYLAIYQSSSPSYLLLAGMDRCIQLIENKGMDLFLTFDNHLNLFYSSLKKLKNLWLLDQSIIGSYGVYDFDLSKLNLFILKQGFSGRDLSRILREQYKMEIEMEAVNYILGISSICDTKEGFHRFSQALIEIDTQIEEGLLIGSSLEYQRMDCWTSMRPRQILLPSDAVDKKVEQVKLSEAGGRISAGYISLYPPGAPILVPGEEIEDKVIQSIGQMICMGLKVTGIKGSQKDYMEVLKD